MSSSVLSPSSSIPSASSECRVCRSGSSPSSPLYSPCLCRGSIEYVHQDCLLHWLQLKNKKKCELCAFEFQFSPIYSSDAPASASLFDVLIGLVLSLSSWIPWLIRLIICCFGWLFIVPLITTTMWRAYFYFSYNPWSLSKFFRTHYADYTTFNYWLDSQYGTVICIMIFILTLTAFSLRELVKEEQALEEIMQQFQPAHNNNNNPNNVNQTGDNAVAVEQKIDAADEKQNNEIKSDEGHPELVELDRIREEPPESKSLNIVAEVSLQSENKSKSTINENFLRFYDTKKANNNSASSTDNESLPEESQINNSSFFANLPSTRAVKQRQELSSINQAANLPIDDSFTVDNINNIEQKSLSDMYEDSASDGSSYSDEINNDLSEEEANSEIDTSDLNAQRLDSFGHQTIRHRRPKEQNAKPKSDINKEPTEAKQTQNAPNEINAVENHAVVAAAADVVHDAAVAAGVAAEGEQLIDNIDDVPLQQWLGLTGEWRLFFLHLLSVLAFNAFFLFSFLFSPLNIGRLLLYLLEFDSSEVSVHLSMKLAALINGADLITAAVPPISANSTASIAANITSLYSFAVSSSSWSDQLLSPITVDQVASFHAKFHMEEVLIISIGYIFLLIVLLLVTQTLPVVNLMHILLSQLLLCLKVSLLLGFELLVFPTLLGFGIDFASLFLFQSNTASRIILLRKSPVTMTLLHWFIGIVCMLVISFFASLLRKTIRRSVLSKILRYPDDFEAAQPFRDLIQRGLLFHCKKLLKSVCIYCLIVLLTLHIPLKMTAKLWPNFVPLRYRLFDPIDTPIDLLFFQFALPIIIEHCNGRQHALKAVKSWFSYVGKKLNLYYYLIIPPTNINNNNNANAANDNNIAAVVHVVQESHEINHFQLRIFGLLLTMWITYAVLFVVTFVFPLAVGRWLLLQFKSHLIHQDIYAFFTGLYILGALAFISVKSYSYTIRHNIEAVYRAAVKYTAIAIKLCFLSCFVLGAIPILLGLLVDLVIIQPLRVGIHETPLFSFYQAFAIGIILEKLLIRTIMAGGLGPNAQFKKDFEAIKRNGWENIDVKMTTVNVILPVLQHLIILITVPYIFATWFVPRYIESPFFTSFRSYGSNYFPQYSPSTAINSSSIHGPLTLETLLDYEPVAFRLQLFHSSVFRYSFPAWFLLWLLYCSVSGLINLCTYLQKSSFEQRYMVGKKLLNANKETNGNSQQADTQRTQPNIISSDIASKNPGNESSANVTVQNNSVVVESNSSSIAQETKLSNELTPPLESSNSSPLTMALSCESAAFHEELSQELHKEYELHQSTIDRSSSIQHN
jgi:E3 ubiquitin-protein ligase DOA10